MSADERGASERRAEETEPELGAIGEERVAAHAFEDAARRRKVGQDLFDDVRACVVGLDRAR